MNLSYHTEPFLHITASLDVDFYQKVNDSWNKVKHEKYTEYTGNRSNILLEDGEIYNELAGLMLHCNQRFGIELIKYYPKLIDEDLELKCRILYSENKATDTEYKIRGWHLDTGDKLMVGLWYFKHPDEDNDGGDLLLMNPTTKEIKKFEYGTNQLIIFPNLPTSWHAVTPRKPSKYPRRYVNLLLEIGQDKKLHNYQRVANSVDSEFRGKLINYYEFEK